MIKYLFQTIIVLSFVGIVYFMFDWQTASGIVALILLVTTQVLLIASKTKVKKAGGKSVIRQQVVASPAKTTPRKAVKSSGESINSEIFSKFQQNLSLSTSQKEEPEEQDVVLSISSKGKQSRKKTAPPAPTENEGSGARVAELLKKTIQEAEKKRVSQESSIAEKLDNMPIEPLGSIFDDLDEKDSSASTAIKPKGGKKQLSSIENSRAPLQANENLSMDLFSGKTDEAVDDEEVVVSISADFIRDKNYIDALGTINKYYEACALDDMKEIRNKEIIRMKGECEFELEDYLKASKSWQELFNKYMKPKEDGFLALLEEIMEKFTRQNQQQYAVQFYFTALNEYRQLRNTRRMDEVYAEIEEAYNTMEDWPRLIQTYQNHLTIKKIIKDYKGQIVLLDHLGKLQYDQGDANGSKASYQQSIAIKKELAKRRG